jgi:hypothetical protein
MAEKKQQAKTIKEEFKTKGRKETREPKAERDTSDNSVKETIREEAKRGAVKP